MSTYDALVGAWIAAWNHLEAATRLQEKYPERDTDPIVDRLHRAAGLYAQLACAPTDVGRDAGAVMAERRDTDEGWRRNFEATMKKRKDKTGEGVSA